MIRAIAFLIALPLLSQTHARVTETAGLARTNEPITITVQGKQQTYFVSIGPRQTQIFKLDSLRPNEPLAWEKVGNAGFKAANR